MKKIFILLLLILLNINVVFAAHNEKDYSISFNGSKFNLLYSIKNKDFGGYLNEYYKKGDTYNIWSELVAVHHFPNAYSPIDQIKDFKDYLGSMHVPSALTFDDKRNTAMIDFIMISEHNMPVVIEFNIFKYEKSKKCGSIAIQYARRYTATTTMQIEAIKKDIEKNRKHLIKKVKNFKIPEIISKDIDKCISAADLIEENQEKTAEETIEKQAEITEAPTEEIASNETIIENENENTAENQEENQEKKDSAQEVAENTTEDNIVDVSEKIIPADTDNTEKKEIKPEEPDTTAEESQIKAPIPVVQEEYNYKNKKSKKIKKINYNYEVVNDKNDYIATPRTKDDLKNEIKAKKQRQKDIAAQRKIQAKNNKKQAKIDKKAAKNQEKINKKEAKKVEKAAKKPYTVSNNNTDFIAKPRTKKEIKEHNKQLRKKAKERAKKAKQKLD